MRSLLVVPVVAAVVLAGPRFGGRVGYYSGTDPRTDEGGTSPIFGGQFLFPIMDMIAFEFSAGYASSETDILMQDYLLNYLEEEEGLTVSPDSLLAYLQDEWGWDGSGEELLSSYTATFHDLDLGATLKVNLPISGIPFEPYIGGGGGAHIIVSDADLLIQYIQTQTGQGAPLDVYDKIHPAVHAVLGANFQPSTLPLSLFAEYKYSRSLGDDAGSGDISSVYAGVNLGF